MRHARRTAALAAGCLIALAAPARADQILTVDGGWTPFSWAAGPGSFAVEGAFTFTAPGSVVLKVTDSWVPGDQFLVHDGNLPLGMTGSFTPGGAVALGPDQSYGSPFFSWAEFNLGPGPHSITVQTVQTANNSPEGVGFLRVDTPQPPGRPGGTPHAPEPGAVVLAAVGGALALGYRLRRVLSV